MKSWNTLLAAATCLLLAFTPEQAQAEKPAAAAQRIAVVVGANAAAPGRKPLRFSQDDAQAFGRVLVELGGFRGSDVHVLLDPDPSVVLATLDTEIAKLHGEAVIIFYYSGHADAGALYPRGRALTFESLRTRLSDPRVSVRIGIIDACRGGGWTGAKGLTETAPFEVTLPMTLDNEGSVLIASSSGLEDAHESEQLGGSFFTHHWNAGLRGAGDRNADGRVTLGEAFEYAKALTIRDTALHTTTPQHPSFAMNLRGRQDLSLSTVSAAGAVLLVSQHEGPLELVHLDSGVVVLELPQGERTMRLAVAPGRYLLRRRQGAAIWAEELVVAPGQTTRVDEQHLQLLGQTAMAVKRSAPRPLTLTTLPARTQEITSFIGISHQQSISGVNLAGDGAFQFGFVAPRGLSDRWQWLIPNLALTYRGGDHGGFEWVPSAGLVGWGVGYSSIDGFILTGVPALNLDFRYWLTERSSIDFGLGQISSFRYHSDDSVRFTDARTGEPVPAEPKFAGLKTWRSLLALGYTHTLADAVTLHIDAAYSQNTLYDGGAPSFAAGSSKSDMVISLGSVHNMGMRPLPLVRVHLRDGFALNFDAAVHYHLADQKVEETYLFGTSFFW